jgi:type I restriction enzyme S subunit
LPEEWEWCNLEQITSKITDWTHKTPNYIKEDDIKWRKVVKFISAKNIKDYKLIVDDFKNILEEEHFELNKKIQLEKWDVFIAKSWSIWQSTVFNLDEEYSIFESLAILKNIDKNMSEYICLFVNSDVWQKQIKSKSKWVAVQHLHLEDIRRLQIPLPPLPEQNEIVKIVESKLSVVEKLEKIVNDNIRKAENLKQSILKKAFEGKLVKEI